MGMNKIKPHLQKRFIQSVLESKAKNISDLNNECFVISFRHLDRNQGDSFNTWQKEGKLATALDVLYGYCQRPLDKQFSDNFKLYGNYPPNDKAGYRFPPYVPEDAKWARIHINGTQILAGHIVRNVFYIVFLDPNHSFYKTDIQDR